MYTVCTYIYILKIYKGREMQGSGRKLFKGHSHLSQDEPTFDKLMNSVLLVNLVPQTCKQDKT